ncbi:MAG: hypothetical protein C0404_01455 [Verrucomicrobia bacterium]|nr:hypothetical protein [Verrucomicrobiota bacterium]
MQTQTSPRKIISYALIVFAAAALLLLFRHQHRKTTARPDNQEPPPAQSNPGPAHVAPGTDSPATSPQPGKLTLAGTAVKQTRNGLAATIRFSAGPATQPESLSLIVRLPRTGNARILDLASDDSVKYSGIGKRVSEDGKFAIFQGTPEPLSSAQFLLEVSGPTTADIRGTCGIEPFQLGIQPTGTEIHRQ